MNAIKIAAIAITLVLIGVAVAIGGGAPLSPAKVASALEDAAHNVRAAEENTAKAAASTRALITIARNVDSQVRSSRRLLETQLRLEGSARHGARRTNDLRAGIDGITAALIEVKHHLQELAGLSPATVSAGERSASRGESVGSALAKLRSIFRKVVHESRELNRKARGYQRLTDRP